MLFEPPLKPATLIRRYKRFLADVVLESGEEVTAHCANPGAMTGLALEGQKIWLQPSNNPKRKLKYSWVLVDHGQAFTSIDTMATNKIVHEALKADLIPELAGAREILPEQKYGENSRIDFLLRGDGSDTYLEVKSVSLVREAGLAEFPDTVTARGAKHLVELSAMKAAGYRAVMLFLIQRDDCTGFRVAADIDPKYATALKAALAAGVEALVYDTKISTTGISLNELVPFDI